MPEAILTTEARWNAVLTHDAAQDGQFWYGVRSTGIYCRPGCPSRRPRRENVTFFDSPDQAQAAGYRACLRCQPDRVDAGARAVAKAKDLLDTSETAPNLTQLAAAVGLSSFHLQRLFKARVGVSPKQYAIRQRSEKLKTQLRRGASVTAALYDAGHESPATLYARSTDQLGMTPRHYARGGAGQMIHFTVTESRLGPMLVAATERGLCAVRFGEPEAMSAELRAEYPAAELLEDAAPLLDYLRALDEYLAGQSPTLPLQTDAQGSDFQHRVWAALCAIPYGETRTYAEIAQALGDPNAVRAVARACATNPVALVVPCHRVLRKGGALAGYRWGLDRKKKLLEQEAPAPQTRLL